MGSRRCADLLTGDPVGVLPAAHVPGHLCKCRGKRCLRSGVSAFNCRSICTLTVRAGYASRALRPLGTNGALGTASAGTASTVSRSDHVHALPALTSCTGILTVAKGGTEATTAAEARANLGITPANIGAATSDHNHENEQLRPAAIEIVGNNGIAYIDFHHGSDGDGTEDYTTRLFEADTGALKINVNGVSGNFDIFSEYNKPYGTYTGTGSTTSRSIAVVNHTAHLANLLVITTDNGYIVLVGVWGAVAFLTTNGDVVAFSSSKLNFQGGTLKMAGTDSAFNESGRTYYYYFL